MIKKKRGKYPNLIFIIISDLFVNLKFPLVLLFLVFVSGISVVIMTYKTRELIIFHEKIILEKEALEVENRHLMLEEKVLCSFAYIESFAIEKFNMKYIEPSEENTIRFYN